VRHFFIYLAVVTLLFPALAASDVNVAPGHVYEVNLLIQYPLPSDTSWAGVYGSLSVDSPLDGKDYPGPQGYFTISPADVREANAQSVQLYSNGKLVVSDLDNWYVAISQSDDVNFDALVSTCDKNIDALLDGNFCDACVPSKTYDSNASIVVRDKNYCAREALLYGGKLQNQ
jgi:hypothetical protein